MKLSEILTENRADFIAKASGVKLVTKAYSETGDELTPEQIINILSQGDPTNHKQYLQWITNQYIKGQFRLEDMSRIRDELAQFMQVKNRLDQKDINKYTYYQLSDVLDKIFNKVELNQNENNVDLKDVKVLYDGPLGLLAIPLTKEASCELGRGTKWCTAADNNNMFNYYVKTGPLYIWRGKNGEKYQFHFNSRQFMDAQDRSLSKEQLDYFRTKNPVMSKLFKQYEHKLLESGNMVQILEYLEYYVVGRWPEAEPYILEHDTSFILRYINDVIKGRWPEAEPIIALSAPTSWHYAIDVIKGRWPEAEPIIMKDPQYAVYYARDVIKGRWPEAEPYIMESPEEAFEYAREIIQGRWPEAEPYIMQDPRWAVEYAYYILDDTWPEAEPYIMKKPKYAAKYARIVMYDRWPEAEENMRYNTRIWNEYKDHFDIQDEEDE